MSEAAKKRDWRTVTVAWIVVISLFWVLFWLGWGLAVGSVPEVSQLQMVRPDLKIWKSDLDKTGWILTLPFPVSRAWDPFVAPVFVWFACQCLRRQRTDEVIFGLKLGLVFGLVLGLIFGSLTGLLVWLIIVPPLGLSFWLVYGLTGGVGYCIGFGAIISLTLGFPIGLASAFVITLPLLIAAGIVRLGRRLFRADYSGIRRLLTGTP